MGVKNLWRLLLPVGKRISIETLSHQTLAIDASIWLTQISKACRDPETGRLLPNRPHVRIFLLRLMRLLYHRIKPVVVFDGIMPEVKRRELQRRRDRREKLWRGTAGENGADADAALKRTAKKILVKQLKEWREKKLDVAGGKNNPKVSPSKRSSSKKSAATAFAAGFTTGEEEADGQVQNTQPDNVEQLDTNAAATAEKEDKIHNEDVISINSSGSDDEVQQSKSEAMAMNDDNNIVNDNAYESEENDWEMAAAIQSSIDDSMKEQQQQQQQIQHQDLSQQPVEAIASLPSEARSQWMESQYKAQRIQSRRECIGAAANPENYSSTQLRNFLKGSKLNKKMGEIGKLAGKLGETDTDDNGFVTVDENRGSVSGHRRVLKRPNHNNNNDDDSDDDLLNNNEQSTIKALFGDDSDESDEDVGVEEEGGGFLLPNKDAELKQATSATTAANDEIVIDDSSADGDSVEQETNGAATLSDHNMSHTHSNERVFNEGSRSTPSELVRNRFMAFTSADEEWATWGEADTQNNRSTEQPTKSIATKSATADMLESDSDSDGDDDPTFLPLHQKLNAGSSFTNTTAKSITSSYNPTPKTQDALEDEEDDDIEWEDGSDINEDNNGERKEETVPLNESNQQSLQEESEEDDDENIDWQEGGDDESVSEKLKADQSSKLMPMKDDDNDDVVILKERTYETNEPKIVRDAKENAIEIDETVNATSVKASTNIEKEVIDLDKAQPEVYLSDSSSNSFDMSDMNHDDPTTAALRHAQETASKLTDWAGRAVQRAIAAHIEENGGPSPEQRSFEKKNEMVDLTADDENDSKSNLEDTINQNAEHVNTATNAATETMNLFDTSLEGLNKVHDDIIEEEKLMERDMSTITDEMKMDILSLLQLCGIPWVESPSEAEAQCAELEKLGLVDGIVTEDSDVFVFGGRKVYKNFFNEQKYVEAYFAKDIQKDLALGRSQLVALAMLLGGDYTDGVKGVGIVNGMEILQSFAIEDGEDGIRNGLQRFREWLDGIGDPLFDDKESSSFLSKERIFHKKHQSARTRWIAPADFPSPAIIDGYMNPAVDNSAVNFTWGTPDIEGLRHFCANSIGWDNEETDRVVKPVLKILESSSTQTRIESYFMKYDDNITFAKVKSKRLKAVLDDIQTEADKDGPNKKQRLDDEMS